MKLAIQIPCFNEEKTLGETLRGIPKKIAGIDKIEIIVIDDGSTDNTAKIAKELGVHRIVRFKRNRGLASSFREGIKTAISINADIIINLDGDNQYPAGQIPELIAPILAKKADIVIGNRSHENDARNPIIKRKLYKLGRLFMNRLCSSPIPDPVSGFRAISREAARSIFISSSFSYTLEMIIQAEHKHLTITHIPITTNNATRPSRLFRNSPQFIYYSLRTVAETYLLYKPFKFFTAISSVFLLSGIIPIVRFLALYFSNGHAGHIQSLVLGGVAFLVGVALFITGMLSHLSAHNRFLLEELLKKSDEK